jgi:hypothetical protein
MSTIDSVSELSENYTSKKLRFQIIAIRYSEFVYAGAFVFISFIQYWVISVRFPQYPTYHSLLLLQSALQPLVGFWPAQLSLSILSRKVFLQSAVVSGTSNPQLGGEPGI